jgi:hypothetical protein
MDAMLKLVGDSILETTLIAAFLGSVLSLVFGAMLVMDSARAFRINERMGRWVSTRMWIRPLDISRDINWRIYRRHRLVGIAVVLWTAYVLYALITRYRLEPLLFAFRSFGPKVALEWMIESTFYVLVAANTLILVAGIVLIARPAAIRALESWGNRSFSERARTRTLEATHDGPDRFVHRHPVLSGWLVMLGSLYVLANLAFVYLGKLH